MNEATRIRPVRLEERSELERWTADNDEDRARRARIVILAAQGKSIREIGEAVGSHPVNVKKWIRRFNETDIQGLDERKRGPKKGSRARFTEEDERAILELHAQSPRSLGLEFDRWSPQKLADAAVARGIVRGISHVTVRAMLASTGKKGTWAPAAAAAPNDGAWSDDDRPSEVAELMHAGQEALDGSDNREAADRFRAALEVEGLSVATEAVVRARLAQALEGLARYDDALETVRRYDDPAVLQTLPPRVRALVKLRLGWVNSWLRNYPRAIARLNEAIKIYRESDDSDGLAQSHYALGRTYMEIHESSMARDHLERAIDLQRLTSNHHFLAQVYLRLGTVEFNEGDIAKASDFWERARELAEGSSDDNLLGLILMNLGVARIHADRGERDRATKDLERAIFFFERGGHRAFLAQAHSNLGDNLRFAGEWERSLEHSRRAFELAKEVGDARGMADPLITIAEIAVRQGRYDEAYSRINESLELLRKIEDRWGESYSLRVLAGVYHRTDHATLAVKTLRDALHLATIIKDMRGVTASHLLLAELHIAEERFEQAGEYIELARGGLKADPSQLRSSGLAQRLSGRLERVRGRFAEAQQQIAQSISIFTAVADLFEIGLSHLEMADLHAQMGDGPAERQHLDHAIELFTKLGAAPDLSRAVDLQHRPEPVRDDTIPPVAAASIVPAGEHKASDVLLMQRLLDASASRELLLQELVSIVEENFSPGRVLLLEREGTADATVTLARGCDAEAAATLAREINWAIAADGRMASGAVFTLDDRTDDKVVLYLERVPPADRLRPLLRQAELGLETCALRESSRRSAESEVSRPRVETVIPGFILAGVAMREVIERIHKIRTSDVTVLITGESGTGKELVARAIHAGSERRRAVFLPFNCTATPKEIIDSQLFGHRRGSFTGATSNYPGIIRAAEGGTLFLDEIGDLALEVQPKLLRFLESGEIQPLGESKPAKVDVRVVAATNSDLERAVEEGRFREDLFHRLNIIRIVVPPLRERREEIPVLADHFLKHFAERLGKSVLMLTPDAMTSLTSYFWPGNVRQLRNEMERVAAYAVAGSKVAATDLSPELTASGGGRRYERTSDRDSRSGGRSDQDRGSRNLKEATAVFERNLIETALERSGYSLSRAARELGMSRRGLHVKMAQLGISRSSDFA